jgi:hypothetical protein
MFSQQRVFGRAPDFSDKKGLKDKEDLFSLRKSPPAKLITAVQTLLNAY